MPAGPGELGFVYFVAAKLVGYTAFCRWAIQPQLGAKPATKLVSMHLENVSGTISNGESPSPTAPNVFKAGAIRTLIGVTLGAAVGFGFWNMPWFANHDVFTEPLFFSVLVPFRIFEWWLLLHWVYRDFPLRPRPRNWLITGGIATSFALDALGVAAAFVLPGGMWVC